MESGTFDAVLFIYKQWRLSPFSLKTAGIKKPEAVSLLAVPTPFSAQHCLINSYLS